jgi:chromosome segregation ATPase
MSFENKVQQWVQVDNELKKLNDHIKKLREQRNVLETNLTNYAKTNNMTNSTIQLNQDRLKFVDTKVPEPLTFKYLEKTLGEIIKDESKVQLIMEHIKQKRAVKIVPEIKRFSNN